MEQVRAITKRGAERITATASVCCLIAIVLFSGIALTLYTGIVQALPDADEIGAAANASVCGDWADFVLTQNKAGLSATQIENVWKVTTAKSGDAKDAQASIAGQCGTVSAILKAAGR